MPGNICGHTHFYGAFARGMAIPGDPPRDFPEILAKLWWRLDKVLTLEDVRYSALVCLVDAVRHGAATLVDHHASPNAIVGSLDEIAEAAGVGRDTVTRWAREIGLDRKPSKRRRAAAASASGPRPDPFTALMAGVRS